MTSRCGVFCLFFALSAAATAGGPGFEAQFMGGTVELPAKADGRLVLSGTDDLVVQCRNGALRIPYAKVNTLEYGQNVSRRYAEAILISPVFLLAKTRKHFVTLGYADEQGKQQVMVLRVSKGDIRAVLTSLAARTGRRVEYQDEEARKSGGG
jgi:hypothetical protein